MRLVDAVPAEPSADALYAAFTDWAAQEGLSLYAHQDEAAIELFSHNNVVLATAGTGATDCRQYRSIALQIKPAAGTVTAGVISFEGSNDSGFTDYSPVFLNDASNPNLAPVSSYSLAASTTRSFNGPIGFAYFRARISTGVTGTTTGLQALTILRMAPFVPVTQRVSAVGAMTTAIDGVATTGLRNLGASTCRLGPAMDAPGNIANFQLSAKYVTTNPTLGGTVANCWFIRDVGNSGVYETDGSASDGSSTVFPARAPDFTFVWPQSVGHLGAPDILSSVPFDVPLPACNHKILFRNLHTTATANVNDTETILKRSMVA